VTDAKRDAIFLHRVLLFFSSPFFSSLLFLFLLFVFLSLSVAERAARIGNRFDLESGSFFLPPFPFSFALFTFFLRCC